MPGITSGGKYPQYAKYNGSGDPDAESSFTCTAR